MRRKQQVLYATLGITAAFVGYFCLTKLDQKKELTITRGFETSEGRSRSGTSSVVNTAAISEILHSSQSKAQPDLIERTQQAKTSGDSLPFVKWSFDKLWELRSAFNATEQRNEVYDALLATPGALKDAEQIIVDPAFAQTSFGSDQAKARVYAIKLLEHAAKNGDPAPVKATLSALNKRLANATSIKDGERADVRDLLTAHLTHDFDSAFRDLEAYLRDTNYHPHLVQAYGEALQYAIIGKDGRSNEELRGYVAEMRRLLAADKFAMTKTAD